jgi:hypothetical protein
MLCSATADLSGCSVDVHGTACLPSADSAAPESLVLSCLRLAGETRYLLVRQAYRLDVVWGQNSADSIEYGPSTAQESD